ncbi:MAG: MarR family winged helix-turn-helix transcriptional regulator [Caldilineaceae bacterium]
MQNANQKPSITAAVIAQECLAVRLRLINRAVSRMYDQALRPLGLRVSQLNILVAITQFEQARQQDICDVLSLERSTLSRDVERMCANGWVESVPGQDARTNLLRLTPAGQSLVEQAIPAWAEAQQQVLTLLGKDVATTLNQIVASIRTGESSMGD